MVQQGFPRVDVLLASFVREGSEKGLEYLREQLDSLVTQDYPNFRILIRDDMSPNSRVMGLLQEYKNTFPDLIEIIHDNKGNLGFGGNFQELMMHSDAPYVSFCDQDDIWSPGKISHSIETMLKREAVRGTETPIMVHHDAQIIGPDGQKLFDGMADFFSSHYASKELCAAFMHYPVFGFTATLNRALIEKSLPFFEGVKSHDRHVSAVAASFGEIYYDQSKLAGYRFHDQNASDRRRLEKAQQKLTRTRPSGGVLPQIFERAVYSQQKLLNQHSYIRGFYDRYYDDPDLNSETKEFLRDVMNMFENYNPLSRILTINKYALFHGKPLTKLLATFLTIDMLQKMHSVSSNWLDNLRSRNHKDSTIPELGSAPYPENVLT